VARRVRCASLWRADLNDLTDRHPLLAIKSMHDKLLDGPVVGRAGIQRDSRQQTRCVKVFQVSRLEHQVLAGKVIAALLQYLAKGIGPRIGGSARWWEWPLCGARPPSLRGAVAFVGSMKTA
jgi:hypothetical protein